MKNGRIWNQSFSVSVKLEEKNESIEIYRSKRKI